MVGVLVGEIGVVGVFIGNVVDDIVEFDVMFVYVVKGVGV